VLEAAAAAAPVSMQPMMRRVIATIGKPPPPASEDSDSIMDRRWDPPESCDLTLTSMLALTEPLTAQFTLRPTTAFVQHRGLRARCNEQLHHPKPLTSYARCMTRCRRASVQLTLHHSDDDGDVNCSL